MNSEENHWRFNSNITWHYFCSVYNAEQLCIKSNNAFMKYHHLRTQLYFSICTIESFMNVQMRKHLEVKNEIEENIIKKLRDETFIKKVKNWPENILGKPFQFKDFFWEFYDQYKGTRDEITHPKIKDHSIYIKLDEANPTNIRKNIALTLVDFYEALEKPWPYWLTGWNYVGLNSNPSWPFESNNCNGFYYSLMASDYPARSDAMNFEKRFMKTKDDYLKICEHLENLNLDIEPFDSRFPQKPRLTKMWWNQEYLLEENKNYT